jgi:hypothetical protein
MQKALLLVGINESNMSHKKDSIFRLFEYSYKRLLKIGYWKA